MRSRRAFLSAGLTWAGGLAAAPSLITRAAARPGLPHGTSSGDVTRDRAVVWSCTDRPARMLVEWSTTESFRNVQRVRAPQATALTGYTARIDLTGLPPGQRIFYRVVFEDLSDSRNRSQPSVGSFLSAPRDARDLRFVWSADTVGQGWGINAEWAACASTRRCAARNPTSSSIPAIRSTPTRRCRRRSACPTARSGETRHPGQVESGRSPRRVPRQLPLQPDRRTRPPLQRRGRAGGAVGRPRGARTTGSRA